VGALAGAEAQFYSICMRPAGRKNCVTPCLRLAAPRRLGIEARALNWRETQAAPAAPMACLLFEIGLALCSFIYARSLFLVCFKNRLMMLKIRVSLDYVG
jgi:hypothetical protein